MGHPNAVTAMNFSDSDLDGSIPPDVALLEHLESFSASQTSSLRGTLPDSIGMWTNLRHFEVSSKSLSGTLPDSIARWTSLETFAIGGCDWSGTLPEGIGQWTELQRFNIDAVTPAWFSDPALYREGFNGALPSSIGDWNKIQEVRMYGNSFTAHPM